VKSGLESFEMISFNIENLRRAEQHGILPGKLDEHLRATRRKAVPA
jgi:hypothetical protein